MIPYRRASALLCLYVLMLFTVVVQAADSTQQGILWQISRPDVQASYLFGTVHTDDPRVTRLPAIVREKFKQADSFVSELKSDLAVMQEASRMMLLPAGRDLEDIIGVKRFASCVRLLADYGIPEQALRHMKPWAVAVTLSVPTPKIGVVLDMQLYLQAQQEGKRLYGLETAQEQMNVFEAFDEQQQIRLLDDAIKYFGDLSAEYEELIQYYLQRDLTALQEASEKNMLRGDSELARLLMERILHKRNHRMLDRIQGHLQQGNSFIAVGALHLPGDEGLLRLLERQGYKVTPVY